MWLIENIASGISIRVRKVQIRCRAKRFGPECKLSKPILVSRFSKISLESKLPDVCEVPEIETHETHGSKNCQLNVAASKREQNCSVQLRQTFASGAGTHGWRSGAQQAWFQQRWLPNRLWVCSKRQSGHALDNPCFTCSCAETPVMGQ